MPLHGTSETGSSARVVIASLLEFLAGEYAEGGVSALRCCCPPTRPYILVAVAGDCDQKNYPCLLYQVSWLIYAKANMDCSELDMAICLRRSALNLPQQSYRKKSQDTWKEIDIHIGETIC